jgi:hypothetical protein
MLLTVIILSILAQDIEKIFQILIQELCQSYSKLKSDFFTITLQ